MKRFCGGAHFENPPPWFQYDLQGASPTSAEMLSLTSAQLQGASLNGAQLQGASLVNTQLQGASLVGAQLQGAALIKVFTWRADARERNGEGTLVSGPENQPRYHMLGCAFEPWGCDWSSGAFAELKQLITRQVPEGDRRDKALNRIAILDPAKASWTQQQEEKVWTDLARSSPSAEVFIKNFTVKLKEMGCDANLGPYVIHGFFLTQSAPVFRKRSPPRFSMGRIVRPPVPWGNRTDYYCNLY